MQRYSKYKTYTHFSAIDSWWCRLGCFGAPAPGITYVGTTLSLDLQRIPSPSGTTGPDLQGKPVPPSTAGFDLRAIPATATLTYVPVTPDSTLRVAVAKTPIGSTKPE